MHTGLPYRPAVPDWWTKFALSYNWWARTGQVGGCFQHYKTREALTPVALNSTVVHDWLCSDEGGAGFLKPYEREGPALEAGAGGGPNSNCETILVDGVPLLPGDATYCALDPAHTAHTKPPCGPWFRREFVQCAAAPYVSIADNCFGTHVSGDNVDMARCQKVGFKAIQSRKYWHGAYGFMDRDRVRNRATIGPDIFPSAVKYLTRQIKAIGHCTYQTVYKASYNMTTEAERAEFGLVEEDKLYRECTTTYDYNLVQQFTVNRYSGVQTLSGFGGLDCANSAVAVSTYRLKKNDGDWTEVRTTVGCEGIPVGMYCTNGGTFGFTEGCGIAFDTGTGEVWGASMAQLDITNVAGDCIISSNYTKTIGGVPVPTSFPSGVAADVVAGFRSQLDTSTANSVTTIEEGDVTVTGDNTSIVIHLHNQTETTAGFNPLQSDDSVISANSENTWDAEHNLSDTYYSYGNDDDNQLEDAKALTEWWDLNRNSGLVDKLPWRIDAYTTINPIVTYDEVPSPREPTQYPVDCATWRDEYDKVYVDPDGHEVVYDTIYTDENYTGKILGKPWSGTAIVDTVVQGVTTTRKPFGVTGGRLMDYYPEGTAEEGAWVEIQNPSEIVSVIKWSSAGEDRTVLNSAVSYVLIDGWPPYDVNATQGYVLVTDEEDYTTGTEIIEITFRWYGPSAIARDCPQSRVTGTLQDSWVPTGELQSFRLTHGALSIPAIKVARYNGGTKVWPAAAEEYAQEGVHYSVGPLYTGIPQLISLLTIEGEVNPLVLVNEGDYVRIDYSYNWVLGGVFDRRHETMTKRFDGKTLAWFDYVRWYGAWSNGSYAVDPGSQLQSPWATQWTDERVGNGRAFPHGAFMMCDENGTIWFQKYAEAILPRRAQSWFGPCGKDRDAWVAGTRTCVYDVPPCVQTGGTHVWPTAWPIEGDRVIVSKQDHDDLAEVPAGRVRVTMAEPALYLRDAAANTASETVGIGAGGGDVVEFTDRPTATAVTVKLAAKEVMAVAGDGTWFEVAAAKADIPADAVAVRSSGAPAYWWYDTDGKGEFMSVQHTLDYRYVSAELDPEGMRNLTQFQNSGGLMPRAVVAYTATQHCIPHDNCWPRVAAFTPYPVTETNRTQEAGGDYWANMGVTIGFPQDWVPDARYTSAWYGSFEQVRQDLYWVPPTPECDVSFGDERCVEQDAKTEDEGQTGTMCAEDSGDTKYRPHRPVVESRDGVPAAWIPGDTAPVDPDAHWVTLAELRAGTLIDQDGAGIDSDGHVITQGEQRELAGIVKTPPEVRGLALADQTYSLPNPVPSTTYPWTAPWLMFLLMQDCICRGGRFRTDTEDGVGYEKMLGCWMCECLDTDISKDAIRIDQDIRRIDT